jgi:predicted RNA polymerase sigma factor
MKSSLESVCREESERILACLIGRCGPLELAEDALRDALATALTDGRDRRWKSFCCGSP